MTRIEREKQTVQKMIELYCRKERYETFYNITIRLKRRIGLLGSRDSAKLVILSKICITCV